MCRCLTKHHRTRTSGPPRLLLPRGSLSYIPAHGQHWWEASLQWCSQWWPRPCLIRWILLLWKALATNYHLSRDVITLLYIKLKLRPPRKLLQSKYQAHLVSLMVSGALCFARSVVPSVTVAVPRASVGSHEDTVLPPRAPPSGLRHGLWSFVKVGGAFHLLMMNLPPCMHGPTRCLTDRPPVCRPLLLTALVSPWAETITEPKIL